MHVEKCAKKTDDVITRKIAPETKTRAKISRFRAALCNFAAAQFLALICCQTFGQGPHPTQPQAEAAYIYNFGKFVIWPADRAKSPVFQICILGKDSLGGMLDSMVSGQRIGGKKVEMKRLAAIDEAHTCMILFVSSSQRKHLPAILAAAQDFSLLTVSDMSHFAERGGDVGLIFEHKRMRFEVNRDAVEQDHLVISSELLKLAAKVISQQ